MYFSHFINSFLVITLLVSQAGQETGQGFELKHLMLPGCISIHSSFPMAKNVFADPSDAITMRTNLSRPTMSMRIC